MLYVIVYVVCFIYIYIYMQIRHTYSRTHHVPLFLQTKMAEEQWGEDIMIDYAQPPMDTSSVRID